MHESDRIARGKEREREIFDLLKQHRIEIKGEVIAYFEHSTEQEDIAEKIDAWAVSVDGKRLSVQFKYRDAGTDLGIAAVRPYDHQLFQMDIKAGTVRWDRDMKKPVDIYVCLADYGTKLIIADGQKVHSGVKKMLEAYSQGNEQRSFTDPRFWGAELKVVRDRGTGYSGGQKKLVVYLTAALMVKAGGILINV